MMDRQCCHLVTEMKKILQHKYLIISVICILLSGILIMSYLFLIDRISNKIIVTIDVENESEDVNGFLISLEDSFNSFYIDSITFDSQIQHGNTVLTTALHQINGSYLKDNNIDIFKGRYLDYIGDKNSNYALIDDKLAFILFGTYDCIGNEIFIDGNDYLICGITQSPKMKYQFSEYNVYVPLDTIQNNSSVLVSVTSMGTGIQSVRKIEACIRKYGNYHIYNTNINKNRKKFWVYFAISTYLVVLTIISIKWLKLAVKNLRNKIEELLENKYFSDIYLWLTFRGFLILFAIVIIITLLYLSFDKLYSLSWSYGDYIPQSLFEWEHIRASILKMYINTNLGEPMKTLQQIQLTSLNIYIYLIIISLCSSIGFYILWRRIFYIVLLEKDKNES